MLEAPSSRYYLVAPAGVPNYGDELITAGWLRHLAWTAPDAQVLVDTHSPGQAAVLLGDLHPRVRFVDTLWQLCAAAPSEQPWEIAAWVREVINHPGMLARLHHGIAALRGADVLHLLGGGYLNAIWPRHIGLVAGVVEAARFSGGRTAMTGQGLVPVDSTAERLIRALAARFDIVDVRDTPSAELLGLGPAEYRLDDAFLALDDGWIDSSPEHPEVMLCLQSDLLEDGAAKLAGLALDTLRAWEVPPSSVGVVEGIPRVDREVFALFEHELRGARFYPFCDIWDRGLPARPGQTWLSTRFHVHLGAAMAGAGGVALSVRPDYYTTKHRSLTELGTGWTLHEDLDVIPERPVGGGFAEEFRSTARAAKDELAGRVYAPVIRPEPQDPAPQEDGSAENGATASQEGQAAPARRRWGRRAAR
ncbi:polysaccharide pyruvyl transferase WcaK-like protein [Tamaricihabitans halophyticus]|uniref:Polysaccharide pyruvyl transferase WcaK-like protein n=1 Tax=Tamaricihabitans halophyticus TaxID=1262583 RepID=A0A4V2SV84_9PSEU|nr:polysaccharide pyruvyl transferase family protein [Tamaricihabitans halophyticus]TCP57006.1 polysaccharide pyruvyl transferase WcaK-like protein [Tamaricihabitans halophyticus]